MYLSVFNPNAKHERKRQSYLALTASRPLLSGSPYKSNKCTPTRHPLIHQRHHKPAGFDHNRRRFHESGTSNDLGVGDWRRLYSREWVAGGWVSGWGWERLRVWDAVQENEDGLAAPVHVEGDEGAGVCKGNPAA